MNLTTAEAALLDSSFGQLSPGAVQSNFFVVVLLSKMGDPANDPYRIAYAFAVQARAIAFANTLGLSQVGQRQAVLVMQGSTILQASGDSSLHELYKAVTGFPSAGFTTTEATSVQSSLAMPVAGKPAAITEPGDHATNVKKKYKF